MVKGKRSLGVVWRESCRNSVSEEVEMELQKVVTKTLRPLSRSWFGVVLKAWDRPLTDLHISAWSAMNSREVGADYISLKLLRYRCSLLRREIEPAEKQT